MREILFRGKRVDNGEWVYGDLINTPEGKTRIIWFEPMYSDDIHFYKDYNFLVEKETIGQFTGLLDKNGKKVFEGDKVNVYGKPYKVKSSVVVWGKKSHGWSLKCEVLKDNNFDPALKYYGLENGKNIEIIGNIHE